MAVRLGRSLHDLVTRRRDENGALRPATSPRDEIFLLSLSLVSHENHRRRRLLECRSPPPLPPLLLQLSSTPSSFSFSSFSSFSTTVSRLQPPVSPLPHRPLVQQSVFSRSNTPAQPCRQLSPPRPPRLPPTSSPPLAFRIQWGEFRGVCCTSRCDSRRCEDRTPR